MKNTIVDSRKDVPMMGKDDEITNAVLYRAIGDEELKDLLVNGVVRLYPQKKYISNAKFYNMQSEDMDIVFEKCFFKDDTNISDICKYACDKRRNLRWLIKTEETAENHFIDQEKAIDLFTANGKIGHIFQLGTNGTNESFDNHLRFSCKTVKVKYINAVQAKDMYHYANKQNGEVLTDIGNVGRYEKDTYKEQNEIKMRIIPISAIPAKFYKTDFLVARINKKVKLLSFYEITSDGFTLIKTPTTFFKDYFKCELTWLCNIKEG